MLQASFCFGDLYRWHLSMKLSISHPCPSLHPFSKDRRLIVWKTQWSWLLMGVELDNPIRINKRKGGFLLGFAAGILQGFYVFISWSHSIFIHLWIYECLIPLATCFLSTFQNAPVHDMPLGDPVQEPPRGCWKSFSALLPNDIQLHDVAWRIGRMLQFAVLCLHLAYIVTPTLEVWCQLMLVTRSVGPLCCGGICHRAPVTLLA